MSDAYPEDRASQPLDPNQAPETPPQPAPQPAPQPSGEPPAQTAPNTSPPNEIANSASATTTSPGGGPVDLDREATEEEPAAYVMRDGHLVRQA